MANKTVRKASSKAYFGRYDYNKNREAKLARLIKEQPNNEQLKKAAKNIHYRRKTPNKVLGWVRSIKNHASLFGNVVGKAATVTLAQRLRNEKIVARMIENHYKFNKVA